MSHPGEVSLEGVRVPFLPGYSIRESTPLDAYYPKKQTLSFRNGYRVADMRDTGSIDRDALVEALTLAESTPQKQASLPAFQPLYVQLNQCILQFETYFRRQVVEDSGERLETVHKAYVRYWPIDQSIAVTEVRRDQSLQERSQRFVVGRHACPFGLQDFWIGASISIRGVTLHIVDADDYTRESWAKNDAELGPRLPNPATKDDATKSVANEHGQRVRDADSPTKFAEAMLGKELPSRRLQQYLTHGQQVLCFHGIWNDTGRLYGDIHHLKLHYFLEDDSVEIVEQTPQGPKGFLRRVPAAHAGNAGGVSQIGQVQTSPAFALEDLRIGIEIRLYNRVILLVDADGFTKNWLKVHRGVPEEDLKPLSLPGSPDPATGSSLPPHNGYGDPEDSLQNCKKLVPSPPKCDQYKLLNSSGVVLKFEAKFTDPTSATDEKRRFVVSYYAADDTLAVFEPPQSNSGVVGGKLLERCKAFKRRPCAENRLTEADLWVGAEIPVLGRKLVLLRADEYTLHHMELVGHPQADVEHAMDKLRQSLKDAGVVRRLEQKLPLHGPLSSDTFAAAVSSVTSLSVHQGLTLYRHMQAMAPSNSLLTTVLFLETILG